MISRSSLSLTYSVMTLQAALATGQTLNLRGAANIFAHSNATASGVVAPSVLCRITMFDTLYLSKENVSSTTEQTTCLPIVNGEETDLDFAIELPKKLVAANMDDIEMGKLLVKVTNAELTVDEELVIGKKPKFEVVVDHNMRHLQERHLQSSGTMTIAVIRISTSDAAPSVSSASLKNALFGGSVNFAQQYDTCSFGKLKWKMSGNVIDLKLPNRVSSYGSADALVTAAQKQLKAQNGGKEVSKLANKVMMCLPPGTGDWAASAGINHWRAQFNHHWCTSLSGIVHELGHTMGLLHANAGGVDYADRSGYMGSGYTDGVWPRKCFNGFNSWRFGWYSTRHLSHNPLTGGDRLVKLATFVDFKKTAADEVVILNIDNQFYLEYNRAKGFNIHTEHKANQVTVTQPTTVGTNSLAGLSAGQRHSVPNFGRSGKALIIEACKTATGSKGAEIMLLSIGMGKSLC